MAKFPILLHIGYHKTGTSLLQSFLFSDEYSEFVQPSEDRHTLVERFVVPRPFSFDTDEIRESYAGFIERAHRNKKLPVLSHERFSGYAPTGGFDSSIVADRLAETFPDAAVLIVVREQCSHIQSMYSQYLSDGGELFCKDYVKRLDPQLMRAPAFDVEFYKYDLLVEHYLNLFGRDRVLVLPYELLRKNKTEFVSRICEFSGVTTVDIQSKSVNVARPALMQLFQLYVNRWFSDNQLSRRPIIRLPRASKRFARLRPLFHWLVPSRVNAWMNNRTGKYIAKTFKDEFGASNRRLSELIGIDLGQFGYQISDEGSSSVVEPLQDPIKVAPASGASCR